MGPRTRLLSAAAIAGGLVAATPAAAGAQQPAVPMSPARIAHAAATAAGVSGLVVDEQNQPLAGAMVSVLGAASAMTVTDASGRFALQALPPGDYSVRAHLDGFAASPRENVRLGSLAAVGFTLRMARLEVPVAPVAAVATTGTIEPLSARPIIAAGFALPDAAAPAEDAAADDDHSHTDTAWRLRHLTRSVLKDSANSVIVAPDEPLRAESFLGRTTSLASAVFGDLPFSGEVNLLTSSALGSRDLFSGATLPRGIAYLSIGAPTGAGDWTARAAMSQGDLSSWIVAGSFLSRRDSLHSYDLGLSSSTSSTRGATRSRWRR